MHGSLAGSAQHWEEEKQASWASPESNVGYYLQSGLHTDIKARTVWLQRFLRTCWRLTEMITHNVLMEFAMETLLARNCKIINMKDSLGSTNLEMERDLSHLTPDGDVSVSLERISVGFQMLHVAGPSLYHVCATVEDELDFPRQLITFCCH